MSDNQKQVDSMDKTLKPEDKIVGLEKGLNLIQSFDEAHSRQTASQVALRTGMSRSACRRFLLTLLHLGYLQSDGKLFWLTPKVMRLGQAYLESARLPRMVQPSLQRLAMGTQEIAFVSVLDGFEVVYVARNGENRNMNTSFALGARVPAHVTAAGMMLLATMSEEPLELALADLSLIAFTSHTITQKSVLIEHLKAAQHQDWVLSEQQLDLSYRGVSVPLRDHKGRVVAALSVSMPILFESSQDATTRVLPLLRQVAQSLRQLL